ncbi:MAG TPA: NAD-dependent DNA ligase LigA [Gemmatimonadaceae bacterium]|nr:NAD-dependent DNA ligase LigA [Gemmatimonadaceae bacterium]
MHDAPESHKVRTMIHGKSQPACRKAKEKASALRREIRRHDYLYYTRDKPVISDAAYDRLRKDLESLERAHPELISRKSPTQQVGGEPAEGFRVARHSAPMLSLESTRDEDSVRRFVDRVRRIDPLARFVLQPKLDGLSLELVYEKGALVLALTRGNGREGEDVTANARTIDSVPASIRGGRGQVQKRIAVRCEVVMPRAGFIALNRRLVSRGEEPFANTRNAAAGSLRQLDPRVTATRPLSCIAYEILDIAGNSLTADTVALNALERWGFRVPPRFAKVASADEIIRYQEKIAASRERLPIEIDGIVAKADDLHTRDKMGATSHHPRWALAYKFEPRAEVTRIEDVTLQVGRTGVLTPVALLRPVDVSGVTVSRATLHNPAELARRDIRVGDLVRVHRAGDVIPEIVERIPEPRRRRHAPFRMPRRCPACGASLVTDGPRVLCPDRFACPAQLSRALVHLASEDGFDIPGIGIKAASALVSSGLVQRLDDLFRLDSHDLQTLERFADISATKLARAIRNARTIPLDRFLVAIGLSRTGRTTARQLARRYATLGALRRASRSELEANPGLGAVAATAIHDGLHDRHLTRLMDGLIDAGVRVVPLADARQGPLSGRTFAFTGTLARHTRPEAIALVEALGADSVSTVSASTDYVIAGEKTGQKLAQAKRHGVTVLDEKGFERLLRRFGR